MRYRIARRGQNEGRVVVLNPRHGSDRECQLEAEKLYVSATSLLRLC